MIEKAWMCHKVHLIKVYELINEIVSKGSPTATNEAIEIVVSQPNFQQQLYTSIEAKKAEAPISDRYAAINLLGTIGGSTEQLSK